MEEEKFIAVIGFKKLNTRKKISLVVGILLLIFHYSFGLDLFWKLPTFWEYFLGMGIPITVAILIGIPLALSLDSPQGTFTMEDSTETEELENRISQLEEGK